MMDNDTKSYLPTHTVDPQYGSRLLSRYAVANKEPNLELRLVFLAATMLGAVVALWLL